MKKTILYCRIFAITLILILISQTALATEKYLYPFTPYPKASAYLAKNKRLQLDEKGVPYFDYGKVMDNAGRRYNSGFISNYAQALYRDYLLNKDDETRGIFLELANWLINNSVIRQYAGKNFMVFELNFDNNKFGAKAPWVSGWINGKVLPIFVYAYDLTHEKRYRDAARLTFVAFTVPMEKQGLSTFTENSVWFEEVAKEDISSSKILNGHIYALSSIYTYWKWTNDEEAYRLFNLGVQAVIEGINAYDAGFISYYSQLPKKPRILSPVRGYNSLHISQLMWIYSLVRDPILLQYALKFASYEDTFFDFSASSCINCEKYGPENLRMFFGKKYWSTNISPSVIQVKLRTSLPVKRIVLIKHVAKNDPDNVKIISGENLILDYNISKNKKYDIYSFAKLVFTDSFSIELSSESKKVMVLDGIGVDTIYPNPIAVSDFNSYRSSNRPAFLFSKGWKMYGPSNLYIDKTIYKTIEIDFSKTNNFEFSIAGSNDLNKFEEVSFQKMDANRIKLTTNFRYLKLKQTSSPKQIVKATVSGY